jgi:hypothetical protein
MTNGAMTNEPMTNGTMTNDAMTNGKGRKILMAVSRRIFRSPSEIQATGEFVGVAISHDRNGGTSSLPSLILLHGVAVGGWDGKARDGQG